MNARCLDWRVRRAAFGWGCLVLLVPHVRGADLTIYPAADGTLVDGGEDEVFDGTADSADWSFNDTSFEGTITLAPHDTFPFENRLVFEYNLNTVTAHPPVAAVLTFTLRGPPIFPSDAAVVHVYSYPADLLESLGDFAAGPAILEAIVIVEPFQIATYTVDVGESVSAALVSGGQKVGFRFQIDPDSADLANQQAYLDALDSAPATKPFLTVRNRRYADYDDDDDVDWIDYAALAGCLKGPGILVGSGCLVFDGDFDNDVDLLDAQSFERVFQQ